MFWDSDLIKSEITLELRNKSQIFHWKTPKGTETKWNTSK